MDTKLLKKAANASIAHILSGKASQDQWLTTKKDVLNKWAAGYILSPGQEDIIKNMYNREVIHPHEVELFADTFPGKPKATKEKPAKRKALPTVDNDGEPIPF